MTENKDKDKDKNKDKEKEHERQSSKDDQIGTQRVYKKSSPNSLLTIYLPTRELISCGTNPTILKGILFVDAKLVQGNHIYAQLTLTFRYGREDEEVMGIRFCNEAIMSLHQIWPRSEEPTKESLTPLQDALIKRLGDGAYPFTLSLASQAPPSVQLVPAKRYYGAPIGTSYDVRCFIADKTDDKFHRRATVKMGIRVIHRADVFSSSGPENFAALVNNQSSPPSAIQDTSSDYNQQKPHQLQQFAGNSATASISTTMSGNIPENIMTSNQGKSRLDSFPKIRLSPKSFRFSSRFGRSKSEVEKGPSDPFYNYSKSFQEYETCGGPQGAVDKPFLLQEGRVCLRANLDKSWYTHGEDVIVTVNIKNDSRKTVRRMRVCAIQHVDVCMFNNGKFKNIVADSDTNSSSDRLVSPGTTLNSTFILKPQRGSTKNWIALEDSLQRSSEPDEITGCIAVSAIRPPTLSSFGTSPEDRNIFAIYVSYYVKVKLTLSGMGGELSLKLPFTLVHIEQKTNKISPNTIKSLDLSESVSKLLLNETLKNHETSSTSVDNIDNPNILNQIESIDDETTNIGKSGQ